MAVPAYEALDLLPAHASLLAASSIAPKAAMDRGFRTVRTKAELKRLGFKESQCRVPALLIPVRDVHGQIVNYQTRPDSPRIVKGRALKYETVAGSSMALDVPRAARTKLGDPHVPLWITEGARKADAAVSVGLCCIGVLGVWNWRGSNLDGGLTALADWELVALKSTTGEARIVNLVFDSDVMSKPAVHKALERLSAFLRSRGARTQIIYLPAGAGGVKTGLDDYLADGNSIDDLLALAEDELRPIPHTTGPNVLAEAGPYREKADGIYLVRHSGDDEIESRLTNFQARIVADIIKDDGIETQCAFEVEASLGSRKCRFIIPSAQFSRMAWPVEQLGARAVIEAGHGIRDHARAAVQKLSEDIDHRVVYTHLGWRKIDDRWHFLTNSGALGAEGLRTDVEIDVPNGLERYELPAPNIERLAVAIRASLDLLDTGKEDLLASPLAAVYRVVLGSIDVGLHFHGGTNTFKTECAVLLLQHFGLKWSRKGLLSWSSTANALEANAFVAKDLPLLVDDFVPTGTAYDIAGKHQDAERIFRGQGNVSGRARMRADGSLRTTKSVRGVVISTGEETPRGQSLGTRYIGIAFQPGVVTTSRLSTAQDHGRRGVYAEAVAGYVAWLAPRLDDVQRSLERRVIDQRAKAAGLPYARMATNAAELFVGADVFLEFAVAARAVTPAEADVLRHRFWRALVASEVRHGEIVRASEPAARFMELLRSAILSGSAHLAGPDGAPPPRAPCFGWCVPTGLGRKDGEPQGPREQGDRVGWIDGDDIYLDRDTAVRAASRAAPSAGETLPVDARTLVRRMNEKGLLASTDPGRKRLTVRRTLQGSRREVIHVKTSVLFPDDTPQSAPTGRSGDGDGTTESGHRPMGNAHEPGGSARLGRLGRPATGGETVDEEKLRDSPPHTDVCSQTTNPLLLENNRPNGPPGDTTRYKPEGSVWDSRNSGASHHVPSSFDRSTSARGRDQATDDPEASCHSGEDDPPHLDRNEAGDAS